jgi:hypothetical protein
LKVKKEKREKKGKRNCAVDPCSLGLFFLGKKKKGYCRETLADGKKESQDKSDIRDGDDDDDDDDVVGGYLEC